MRRPAVGAEGPVASAVASRRARGRRRHGAVRQRPAAAHLILWPWIGIGRMFHRGVDPPQPAVQFYRSFMSEVPFKEALAVWLRIGLLSFGGPAGQIALMHRIIVEGKKWLDEPRFLHALNYCICRALYRGSLRCGHAVAASCQRGCSDAGALDRGVHRRFSIEAGRYSVDCRIGQPRGFLDVDGGMICASRGFSPQRF